MKTELDLNQSQFFKVLRFNPTCFFALNTGSFNLKTTNTVHCATVVLSLVSMLLVSATATAQRLEINCTDANSAETCSITTESDNQSVATPLLFITAELLEVAQTFLPQGGSCRQSGEDPNTYTCASSSSNLEFTCTKDGQNANAASCTFGGTGDDSLLTFACNRENETNRGGCSISSNEEQINALFEGVDPVTANRGNVLASIRTVCGDFSAESALLRDCSDFLALLNDGDFETANEILRQVAPFNANTAISNVRAALGAQSQNIKTRLSNVRNNQGSSDLVDVSGLNFFLDGEVLAADQLFSNPNYANLAAASSEDRASAADTGKLGFFLNGTLISGEQDATASEGGSDFSSTGITLGVDYRYTNNFVGGMAFSLASTTSDFTGSTGEVTANNFAVSLYGSYYIEQFYIDGTLGLGSSEFNQERGITYTGVNQTMSSSYFGNESTLSISGGANYKFKGWDINPFAQLSSSSVDVAGYEEKASDTSGPGAGWALSIGDQELSSLLFNFGVQGSYVMNKNWGVLIPLVRLELVNELDDDAQVVNGRFVGGGTVRDVSGGIAGTFTMSTNEVDSSYYNLGFGATALMKSGNTAFLYYQATLGYDQLSQNLINAGWRWEI